MKILKGDLYTFITEKFEAERAKAQKELDVVVEEHIRKPIKEAICGPFETIKASISKLSDEYESYLESIGETEFNYKRKVTELSYISSVANNIANNRVYDVTDFLNGGRLAMKKPILSEDTVEAVRELYTPISKRLADLRTLNNELEAIIKASGSGKIAYDTLVSLGIDMQDFVAGSPSLPAVQKLSVDVCVINGGC